MGRTRQVKVELNESLLYERGTKTRPLYITNRLSRVIKHVHHHARGSKGAEASTTRAKF